MTGSPAWAQGFAGVALDRIKRIELERHRDYLVVVALGLGDGAAHLGAQLRPRHSGRPPADGVFEFDLVWGDSEPGGSPLWGAAGSLLPVTASFTWCNYPPGLSGVRVYAAANMLERHLDSIALQG